MTKFVHFVGERVPVRITTGSDTIVEQCHREVTNINKLVQKYSGAGGLPPAPEARYMDVSNIGDLMDVKIKMQEAAQAYQDLPPNIRDSFADPEDFLAWCDEQEFRAQNQEPEVDQVEPKSAPPDTNPEQKPETEKAE